VERADLKSATIADGFQTVYKTPKVGVDFTTLVDKISMIDPELRIRFTSPHPKDFPDEVCIAS
jgi:tRNA A37 methylthiotransferase MiaB